MSVPDSASDSLSGPDAASPDATNGPDSSSGPDARAVAVAQLLRVEQDRGFVGLLADADAEPMDARAERRTTEYVAGITRMRRYLDFLLSHFYRGVLEEVEPALRQILRLGLYELRFVSTPEHAAVSEAVNLASRMLRPGAGKLVNGVLRAVQRAGDDLPEPSTGKPERDLAVRHSHPTWMVRRWLAAFGPDETARLLAWNNARPRYGLRLDVRRRSVDEARAALDAAGVEWEPSPYLDDFVRVGRLQPVIEAGLLAEGACMVQDEAAGLVVRVLAPAPGETIVDMCAAPGGKALYAASRMQDTGTVWAADAHAGRLGLVRHGATTLGLTIVETHHADARALEPGIAPRADAVLLDAPCSGTGVMAKRADLRWHRSADDVRDLVALQDALLDAAAGLVAEGGRLVYSTCSIEPEENEQRVAAFLERHPGFVVERVDGRVPEALVTPDGYYQAFPQRHGIDGAFAACLRRR